MYIKTERNDAELSVNKIYSKKELITEIKTLSYTLLKDILYEKDINLHEIAKDKVITNLDIQNIIELKNIFENTEQILSNLQKENPINIYPRISPYYNLSIELDEDAKLKIIAGSELEPEFTWDTIIQWFPTSEKDEF